MFKTNLKKHRVNYMYKLLNVYKWMCADFNIDAHERGDDNKTYIENIYL